MSEARTTLYEHEHKSTRTRTETHRTTHTNTCTHMDTHAYTVHTCSVLAEGAVSLEGESIEQTALPLVIGSFFTLPPGQRRVFDGVRKHLHDFYV